MFKYVQTCLNNNSNIFYKTVAFKKLFDTYFFYKTVPAVRGVGGGGWVGRGIEGAVGRRRRPVDLGGARRRGGPDLARWDSGRDGGGSRWAPQIFFSI